MDVEPCPPFLLAVACIQALREGREPETGGVPNDVVAIVRASPLVRALAELAEVDNA